MGANNSSSHHQNKRHSDIGSTHQPVNEHANNNKIIVMNIVTKTTLPGDFRLSKAKLFEIVFADNGDNCSNRASSLMQNCFDKTGDQSGDTIDVANFTTLCELILDGHGDMFATVGTKSRQTTFDRQLIDLFLPKTTDRPDTKIVRDILLLAYSSSIRPAGVVTEVDENFAAKLAASMVYGADSVDALFRCWERVNLPIAHACRTYFANCLATASSIHSQNTLQPPVAPKAIKTPMGSFGLWILCEMLPASYNPPPPPLSPNLPSFSQWQVLYDSNSDGLSFSRLETLVFDYKAPTLVLFGFNNNVFIAGVDCEWRKGVTKWGGENCCLVQLLQQFRMVESNPGMIFCNAKDRSAPRGLQFGSKLTHIEIDDGLLEAKLYGSASRLDWIQIVGCGPRSAQQAQAEYRRLTAEDARQNKEKKLHATTEDLNVVTKMLDWGGVSRGNLAKNYGVDEVPEAVEESSSSAK